MVFHASICTLDRCGNATSLGGRAGGNLFATRTGLALWRRFGAPMEARIVAASGGRLRLQPAFPVVMLTTTGARSSRRREIPLAYFTDGDDVVLIASNYGSERHPAWYHNLIALPECELPPQGCVTIA